MIRSLSRPTEHFVDEPEIVGLETPAPLWRRTLRRAVSAVALGGLAAGLLAIGALATAAIAVFLLLFAIAALLGGRVRFVVRRR